MEVKTRRFLILKPRHLATDGGNFDFDFAPECVVVDGSVSSICPGRFMADTTLWISIACILTVFDIHPGKDENGNPVGVKPDFESGMIWYVQFSSAKRG